MKYQKLSEYAKDHGIGYRAAWNMYNRGLIKGYKVPETKTIFCELPEISTSTNDGVVLYARVSSSENKSNLLSQMDRLKMYAAAKGYTVLKEIQEVGSGLNDRRQQLCKLLEKLNYSKIVVEHKDRLTRFGFNYLDILLKSHGVDIEVINETDEKTEDLMQDFISIITSFCARIYGHRRTKRKTESIIKQLEDNSDIS